MSLKIQLTICAFIGISYVLEAQTLNDPVFINFSVLPSSDIQNQRGQLEAYFVELNATAPAVKFGKSVKFFNAFYYRKTSMSFENSPNLLNDFPQSLHDIRYSIILRAQLNRSLELVAIPRLMVRSDFKQSLSSKDLFAQAVLLGNLAINGNPNFTIGLGLALNNDFERNAIIPIASLYYESERFKAEIIYPNVNLLYKTSEKLEFGIFATVDGSISRIQESGDLVDEIHYLRNFQVLVAPTITRQLYKSVYAHFKLGISPVRYYEKLNQDFDPIGDHRTDVQTSFFVRGGFSVRIKKQ